MSFQTETLEPTLPNYFLRIFAQIELLDQKVQWKSVVCSTQVQIELLVQNVWSTIQISEWQEQKMLHKNTEATIHPLNTREPWVEKVILNELKHFIIVADCALQ